MLPVINAICKKQNCLRERKSEMKVINILVFTAILSTVVANMLSQGKFYHCYLQNYKVQEHICVLVTEFFVFNIHDNLHINVRCNLKS